VAYCYLIGNAPARKVILTMALKAHGLVAFTSSMERFLARDLNIVKILMWIPRQAVLAYLVA